MNRVNLKGGQHLINYDVNLISNSIHVNNVYKPTLLYVDNNVSAVVKILMPAVFCDTNFVVKIFLIKMFKTNKV